MPDKTTFLAGAGGVLVIAVVAYLVAQKLGVLKPGALDPTSDKNVVYRGANKVVGAVTGRENDTVGAAIWRLLNPAAAAIEDNITASSRAGAWTSTPYTPPAVIGGPGW